MKQVKQLVLIVLATALLPVMAACSNQGSPATSDTIITRGYENVIGTTRAQAWKDINQGTNAVGVAITDSGEIVYQESFGVADQATSMPVSNDTQFNIGSTSKAFTAVAVMQLVDRGLINLDQSVTTYLPDFTMADNRYTDITVRMLLNHSSGLPGTYEYNSSANRRYDIDDGFMAYLRTSTLKADPGLVSVYCNDGFTLAGILVARVSNMNFEEYLQRNIFSPAKMDSTSCTFREGNTAFARSYAEGMLQPTEYANLIAAGGISSTASDLCRFADCLMNGMLLSADSFQEMARSQVRGESYPCYGLGWDFVSVPEFEAQNVWVINKGGDTQQYHSSLYLLPDQKSAVAITFSGTATSNWSGTEIVQALLEDKGLASDVGGSSNEATPESAPIPEEILDFAGFYAGEAGILKFDFDTVSSSLLISNYNCIDKQFEPATIYTYRADGCFYDSVDTKYVLSDASGEKLFSIVLGNGAVENSVCMAEEFSSNPLIDPSIDSREFDNTLWIPLDLSLIDETVAAISTQAFKEMPGVIALSTGDIGNPYALQDAYHNKFLLRHLRDQINMNIAYKGGLKTLSAGGDLFQDASAVPILTDGEQIIIGDEGYNQAHRVVEDSSVNVSTPDNARVVVFGADGAKDYDSLYDGLEGKIPVTANAYLVLIGEPDSVFSVDIE